MLTLTNISFIYLKQKETNELMNRLYIYNCPHRGLGITSCISCVDNSCILQLYDVHYELDTAETKVDYKMLTIDSTFHLKDKSSKESW